MLNPIPAPAAIPVSPAAASPRPDRRTLSPRSAPRQLLFPREHGAWGMVSLPFVVGVLVAGHWPDLATLAAASAVFSVFLLREPLLLLWRQRTARRKYGWQSSPLPSDASQPGDPRLSLLTYGSIASFSGAYLLHSLPPIPLLLLGCGAVLLLLIVLYFTSQNAQRHPALQIASVAGLTSSSVLAYLAGRGQLDATAFWIWALSAAHSSASVLVVHARLESLIAARRSDQAPRPAPRLSPRKDRRNAALAQAILGICLAVLAATGRPWLALPFVPPTALHIWELRRTWAAGPSRISMHRVGWMQLGASLAFSALLVLVLR